MLIHPTPLHEFIDTIGSRRCKRSNHHDTDDAQYYQHRRNLKQGEPERARSARLAAE
jgi:hypothetical protein